MSGPPSMQRVLLIVLALGCLALGGEAWRLERRIAALRIEVEIARKDDLAGRLAQVRKARAALEAAGRRLGARREGEGPAAAASRSAQDESPRRRRARILVADTLMDPLVASVYRHLARDPGLSQDQIARLRDLTGERALAAWDAIRGLQGNSPGETPSLDEYRQAVAAAIAGPESDMRQLLGDSGYARFEQEMQAAPAFGVVDQMAQSLADLPARFTDQQEAQLSALLVRTQPAAAPAEDPMALLNPLVAQQPVQITDDAVAQASAFLAPEQVAVLRQYQTDQQARNTVMQIYRQAVTGLQKGGN